VNRLLRETGARSITFQRSARRKIRKLDPGKDGALECREDRGNLGASSARQNWAKRKQGVEKRYREADWGMKGERKREPHTNLAGHDNRIVGEKGGRA